MKRILITSAFLLVISLLSFAQKEATPPPARDKTQNIIIRKKGDDKEKTTIVIDGDKITINGKPMEDYKGNIQVTQNDNRDFGMPDAPMPPLPPLPPHGGAKMFTRNFSAMQNSAFLGVASLSEEDGAAVNSVTENSPAEKAGLKKGDVITKVGGDTIDDADDLVEAVGKYKPEDKVTVTYKRDRKENTVTVTLEKNKSQNFGWNNDDNISMNGLRDFSFNWTDNKPRLGLRIQDVENGTGVKVVDVNDDNAPAAKAGLKEDDVITQINGKNIQSVKEAKDLLADVKPGDDIKLSYLRGSVTQTATVHIPKPLQTSDL